MDWLKARGRSFWLVLISVFAIAGVALAVLLGSAAIPNNSVQTGELTASPVLLVGLHDPLTVVTQNPCERTELVYEEVSSGAVFGGTTLDYANRGVDNIVAVGDYEVCIRNDSNVPIRVDLQVTSVTSEELGTCPDAVEAAAGDSTCGPGEGELGSGELTLGHYEDGAWGSAPGGASAYCLALPQIDITSGAATNGIAVLDPDGFCYYSLYLTDDRPIPSVSSTDDVTFTIQYLADSETGP